MQPLKIGKVETREYHTCTMLSRLPLVSEIQSSGKEGVDG